VVNWERLIGRVVNWKKELSDVSVGTVRLTVDPMVLPANVHFCFGRRYKNGLATVF
jgi:hypothetical protein